MHALTRRMMVLAATISLLLLGYQAAVLIAASPAHACSITQNDDCVEVGAEDPGTVPGTPGPGTTAPPAGPGSTQGAGDTTNDPCAAETGYSLVICRSGGSVYTKLRICNPIYEEWSPQLSLADLNQMLASQGCPAVPEAAAPPPSPAELAQRAAASFLLPHPTGSRSPGDAQSYAGYPFTYVGLSTFFWTDQATWAPLTARADAGDNWAEVTATPVLLTYTPGDGSPAVSCSGPGRPWVEADGNGEPTGGACGYRYTKVTGPGYDNPLTSTQTITWRLSWVGSGNTSGTLTQRATSTDGVLNVLQIQTVNR